jgi:PAS domain S-box-containing protein
MPEAKILIVEDEAIEAMDVQQRLKRLGYPLPDIAYNGAEGVRKAEQTRPDLILMDIMMPGELDGVAAAERIRARFDIPIIFLTAYADEKTLSRAKITAPYGYIVKPFQERELHIAVDMALYRHKMDKELAERKKWFATTLSSIGDAVIAATDEDGLITFMNPVAEGLTGWELEDALNKEMTEVFKIVELDTRKPVELPIARAIREGATICLANEALLIAKDGTELPIHCSAAPIRDDKGSNLGVILIFRDITERKQAEERIKALNEQLKDRLAALDAANKELEAFSYSVSHDLRAPLRIISRFSTIVYEDYADKLDAQGKDYLARIKNGTDRMGRLIEDILRLSLIARQRLDRIDYDLSGLAASVMNSLREAAPARNLEVVIAEGLRAAVDPSLMRIALTNLFDNAWKFTAKAEHARIEFGAEEKDSNLVYFVRDNGAGFEPAQAAGMFRPFQRLHSETEFEGTGIGLAIVERIIRRHEGMVRADGEVGKGTTIYFTLG